MADIYQTFLKSPSVAALAPDASLHYITTTTSINEPAAIVKHLQAQDKQLKKKNETVVSCTESGNAVCLETETTYLFKRGGGAILPQMDDNMLADMTAVCPMVHVVQLDASRKISQIRLYWDQSTMLKQVDAIGKTGRNWPIRDGKMQMQLVADSVRSAGQQQSHESSATSHGASKAPESTSSHKQENRSTVNGSRTANDKSGRDDYNSRLFATGEEGEGRATYNDPQSGPRTSAKPQPRQWGELFAGDEALAPAPASGSNVRSPSPGEPVLKVGAGQNFARNRLFDGDANDAQANSTEAKRAHPAKYDHFEFGSHEEAQKADPSRGQSATNDKHTTNWHLDDFGTPERIPHKAQREQERHFGYGIDRDEVSPEKRPIVHAARPTSAAHFTITDERSPAPANARPNSGGRPGMNDSHIGDSVPPGATDKRPLGEVSNTNNIRRGQEFGPHFNMTDKSPQTTHSATENTDPNSHRNGDSNFLHGPGQTKKFSDMESHWGFEETPVKPTKIYKTAGDGMGGRAGSRNWAIGDDFDDVEPLERNQYGTVGGQKQVYKTMGNGMGGRKDTGRGWAIGDDDGF